MGIPDLVFIGGGNMASAMIAGLERQGARPAIAVCDPVAAVRERHAAAGRFATDDLALALARGALVVLAVKPQIGETALATLRPLLTARHAVVSILAGRTCAWLESRLPTGARLVRAMPNTPLAVGLGMTAICRGTHATPADLDAAEALFAAAGAVLRVDESRMDAVTAVSGSGPAYLFRFAEVLAEAAGRLGFTTDESALLVGQTLRGSIAYLLAQPGFPAARLRQEVTSPGGTTAAALQVFADRDLAGMVAEALAAAARRAGELAKA